MASPPPTGGPSPLALPRQRPSLALPGKSRKPSISSTTSSAHPLRQTSFPPPESLEAQHLAAENAHLRQFSPSLASQGSFDDVSDSEIVSAISGPAGPEEGTASGSKKRKRSEKRTRGRGGRSMTARTGSGSLVNGDDGASGIATVRGLGAPSVADAENAEEEDDEEDHDVAAGGGRVPLYEGGQMTAAEAETDNKAKAMFRRYVEKVDAMPLTGPGRDGLTSADMGDRADVYKRSKLKTEVVKKLVNQTTSQSVPSNVVTVVSAYTKMFAGLLIEQAREVQAEWMAVEKKRADDGENLAYKRLKRSRDTLAESQDPNDTQAISDYAFSNGDSATMKAESNSSPPEAQTLDHAIPDVKDTVLPGGAGGLSTSIMECDRGPLLPDHLREALRRYKKTRRGGAVGFTGLSLEGRESTAPRMGGRRLFR